MLCGSLATNARACMARTAPPSEEVKPGERGGRRDSDLACTPTCRIEPGPFERRCDLRSLAVNER